jgi:NAD(P)-dependent dehydrogenase (short-subunit alcohol dehydrogenase family)
MTMPAPVLVITGASSGIEAAALPALALDASGRLAAVSANAGAFTPGFFLHGTGTPQQWREMVLTNVYGTALTARAAVMSAPGQPAPADVSEIVIRPAGQQPHR